MTDPAIAPDAQAAGRFRSEGASHVGMVRRRNEDRFVNRPELGLWAVADGAGGHQAGDVAAETVAATLSTLPGDLGPAELLAGVRQRIAEAHERLRGEASRRGGGAILATTVVALLSRDDHYACLWAGDSRAYLLRDGRLTQLTRDHSAVQELVEAGVISPAEAKIHPRANLITRAVGASVGAPELDKASGELRPGDRFLLCSDGLTKMLDDGEIARLLASDAAAPAGRLIAAALAANADDNVTAVVVDVAAGADGAAGNRERTVRVGR